MRGLREELAREQSKTKATVSNTAKYGDGLGSKQKKAPLDPAEKPKRTMTEVLSQLMLRKREDYVVCPCPGCGRVTRHGHTPQYSPTALFCVLFFKCFSRDGSEKLFILDLVA